MHIAKNLHCLFETLICCGWSWIVTFSKMGRILLCVSSYASRARSPSGLFSQPLLSRNLGQCLYLWIIFWKICCRLGNHHVLIRWTWCWERVFMVFLKTACASHVAEGEAKSKCCKHYNAPCTWPLPLSNRVIPGSDSISQEMPFGLASACMLLLPPGMAPNKWEGAVTLAGCDTCRTLLPALVTLLGYAFPFPCGRFLRQLTV